MKKKTLVLLSTLSVSLFVAGGVAFVNANAGTDNATFKTTGASVKLMNDKNDSGLRFEYLIADTYFNETLFDASTCAWKEGVEVGVAIVPTNLLAKGADATAKEVLESDKAVVETFTANLWNDYALDGAYETSYIYVYNLPSSEYDREFSSVGYITVNGATSYTDVSVKSMAYVASAALATDACPGQEELLQNYIANYSYDLQLNTTETSVFILEDKDYVYDMPTEQTLTATTNGTPTKLTWSVADSSIATVDQSGKITPVKEGRTTVTVTAQNGETATCAVNTYNYYEIGTKAEFTKAFLEETNLWTGGYTHPKSTVAEDTYYNGYYALTADIDMAGAYTFGTHAYYNSTTATEGAGFNGVFDGHGHVLKNIRPYKEQANIFGTIGTKGVVKNLAITSDAVDGWASGLIAHNIFGTIDNVFVSADYSTSGSTFTNGFGTLASYAGATATIKNSVAVMAGAKVTGYSGGTRAFVNSISADATVINSYEVYGKLSDGSADIKATNAEGLTSYSLAEYASQTYDYTGFDKEIWDVTGSLPVMKSVFKFYTGTIATDAGEIVEFDDEISVTTTTGEQKYFAVTASAGTLTESSATAFTFVPGMEASGKTVTITLYAFGKAIDTVEFSVAKASQTTALDGVVTYKQYNWDGSAYVANASDLVFDTGAASLNEATFSVTNHAGVTTGIDATVENGVITVSADTLASMAGSEYTFNVVINAGDYDLKYTKKFDLVTKEISTGGQFDSIFMKAGADAYNGSADAAATYYDGLYRLTANISAASWKASKMPYYGNTSGAHLSDSARLADTGKADFGFNGIFDGQGYTISGVYIHGYNGSLFGTLGRNGVIKNLAITGANAWNYSCSFVVFETYGTMSNVYVEGKYGNSPAYFGAIARYATTSARFENCVTKLTYTAKSVDNVASFVYKDDGATLKNCYTMYGNGETVDGTVQNVKYAVKNKTDYTSEQLVVITPSTLATTTFSGLDESIWNVTEGQLPSFKKA